MVLLAKIFYVLHLVKMVRTSSDQHSFFFVISTNDLAMLLNSEFARVCCFRLGVAFIPL